MNEKINSNIVDYFNCKIREFGPSAKGLDWNGEKSHLVRLSQVAKVISQCSDFSINDFGCGYGTLYNYLVECGFENFDYFGYDLSDGMIEAARRNVTNPKARFVQGDIQSIAPADFTVASGVFNKVMCDNLAQWENYVYHHLSTFHKNSKSGFACNFLTSYSQSEKMREDLFYADPKKIFDFAMRLSSNVSIYHDYGLFDFTIIVRKNPK